MARDGPSGSWPPAVYAVAVPAPSPRTPIPATPSPPLPASFVLAAWANSWLTGTVGLDDVLDALRAQAAVPDLGVAHHLYAADVTALTALDTADAAPLTTSLGMLRRSGAHAFALALPAPGDPLGLGGPRRFTEAAIDAGQAVIIEGAGLGAVPTAVGAGVQWAVSEAVPGSGETLPEADERLARVILDAHRHLAGRGDETWRPDGAEAARRAGGTAGSVRRAAAASVTALPPNAPSRADRVLARAVTCLQIGRFTQDEAAHGRELAPPALVRDLSAAARRGLVAVAQACRAPARTDR
jgi:hypothetical protein